MENIRIQAVNDKDWQAVLTVARQTYKETFAPIIPPADLANYIDNAFTEEKIKAELQQADSAFYLATIDEVPVGYLKINEPTANTESGFDDAMEVQRIYVSEAYHRRGIGRLLMDKAIAEAKALGYDKLWLGVLHDDKRANAFYERMGYRRVGAHDFVMGGVTVTDALLQLDLND